MVALRKAYSPPHILPIDTVLQGDSLVVLKTFPDNAIDSIVCDPPAGINFMGKDFDKDRGGRTQWVAWLAEIMTEALRCLKPGGYGLVWALPRTSHWTALALEESGFLIKDCIFHHFGSGFPKSHDISKAIDRMKGAEREVVGSKHVSRDLKRAGSDNGEGYKGQGFGKGHVSNVTDIPVTAPATPEAQQWQGYGTALKPSTEVWWLVQKPISERTIAANVLRWGTGGLNIDASRINVTEHDPNKRCATGEFEIKTDGQITYGKGFNTSKRPETLPSGRWPAHLLLSHSIFCQSIGTKRVKGSGGGQANHPDDTTTRSTYGVYAHRSPVIHQDPDGLETVDAYICHESCPVHQLDLQSGIRKSGCTKGSTYGGMFGNGKPATTPVREANEGGASRYFQSFSPDTDELVPFRYVSKASRSERNKGCEGLPEQGTKWVYGEYAGDGRGRQKPTPIYRLRDDLTPEQRAYVEAELAKIGDVF